MNIYSTNYGVTVVIKFRINIIYPVVIYIKFPNFFYWYFNAFSPQKNVFMATIINSY